MLKKLNLKGSMKTWRRKWQPTPVFLPGESQGRGAWWSAIDGVPQSRTQLKWLSMKTYRRRQWQPTPVLLPGKSHGWRSLVGLGSWRVGHDWATSLSLFTFMYWRRKWQPTPVFWPGESQGRGAWWSAVYGVALSRTRLKWLSSSSCLPMCIDGKFLKF